MAKKQKQLSQSDLPRITLEETIEVAKKFHENIADGTTNFDNTAKLLGTSPNTTKTKYKIWGAEAYGIIKKDTNNEYSLSENGRKIVAPTYKTERTEAIRKAILTPVILSSFYSDYNDHLIPQDDYFTNLLETKYEIPRERINEAKEIIIENAKFAEILVTDSEGRFQIKIDNEQQIEEESSVNAAEEENSETEIITGQTTKGDYCFYISPIGDEDSEYRKHSDMLLKHLIQPALDGFEIKVIRADKIEKSGLITQQVLELLVNAKICIADLSFRNPNVFYELGVRHACKLPTIQIIRKQEKIPFDVSQGRTIIIDTSDVYTLIDRMQSAGRELQEFVEDIMNSTSEYKESNPISVYLPSLKISLK